MDKVIAAILGVILIVAGVVLGVYLSIWVMFVGGIIQIIEQVKSPEAVNSAMIAWGIVKILFASVGALPGYIVGFLGLGCLKYATD